MNVSFLVFASSGGNDPEVALTYQAAPNAGLDIVVDTVGPPPPLSGSIQPRPSGDLVFWTLNDNDADTAGFEVFCAPTTGACPGDVLVDHAEGRAVDPKYLCGKSSDKTASGYTPTVQPDTQYTFAVAGLDLIGNLGPLALEGCGLTGAADAGANPADPNAPVAAGCACDVTGSTPIGGAASAAGFGIVALAIVRRRKRR